MIKRLLVLILLLLSLAMVGSACMGPTPNDEGEFSDGGNYGGQMEFLNADTNASYSGDTPEYPEF